MNNTVLLGEKYCSNETYGGKKGLFLYKSYNIYTSLYMEILQMAYFYYF